ncbi:unnamed protein product [Orchesella dallaii]|uniref:C2H2-type domain-containing protein n=1 Tax=Orchesella dallaii TaxID=48710 RepID=A0ABP1R1S2_9HEXA
MGFQKPSVFGKTLNFPTEFLDMITFCKKAGLVKEEELSPERLTLAFLCYNGCDVGDHDASGDDVEDGIVVIPVRDAAVADDASMCTPTGISPSIGVSDSAVDDVMREFVGLDTSSSMTERVDSSFSDTTQEDCNESLASPVAPSEPFHSFLRPRTLECSESSSEEESEFSIAGTEDEPESEPEPDEEPWIQEYKDGEMDLRDLPYLRHGKRVTAAKLSRDLEDYACPICTKLPTAERPFIWFNSGCGQPKHFVCYDCVFRLQRDLRARRKSNPQAPFKCHTCRFPWLLEGFKPIRLPETLVDILQKPLLIKSSEARLDRVLSREERKRSRLNRKKTGERLRKYRCKSCPMTYRFPSALLTHKEMVHDKVKYPCRICKKKFVSLQAVRRHVEALVCQPKLKALPTSFRDY